MFADLDVTFLLDELLYTILLFFVVKKKLNVFVFETESIDMIFLYCCESIIATILLQEFHYHVALLIKRQADNIKCI